MKILKTPALILIAVYLSGCGYVDSQQKNSGHREAQQKVVPPGLLTKASAERILGQPADLTESSSGQEKDPSIYQCTYTARSADPQTGKTGAIYFMSEEYEQVSSAKKVYTSIKTSNEDHDGIRVLNDIGDEAYFHSDNQNFLFILVRKDRKMFRMKVNKTTSKTSLDEFNRVAREITAAL